MVSKAPANFLLARNPAFETADLILRKRVEVPRDGKMNLAHGLVFGGFGIGQACGSIRAIVGSFGQGHRKGPSNTDVGRQVADELVVGKPTR